jgi:hypothetical protein
MSLSSLTYTPPIRRDAVGRDLDYEVLEHAAEQYASGDALGAAQAVMRHLFPQEAPDLSQPFTFTQGSSRVTVRVEDGVGFVDVPMVRVPQGGASVAALRYVLQSVNGSGQLFQGRLRGDDVVLEFADKLIGLHPHKLIEVLRRMPVEADRHDDWMERQFGATPLDRAPIGPLDGSELERAAQIWALHWDEVDELLKEALRKRSVWFLNEVSGYALHRIRFALPLCGSVLPRLLEAAGTFNDGDADARKREATLNKIIKEMKALSPEELARSLGHLEHTLTPHTEGTRERMASLLGPGHYRETIKKLRATGYSLDAGLAMIGTYYYLLATHSWPAEIATELKAGLLASSGKPWREAAQLLLDHAEALLGDEEDDEDEEESEDEAEGTEEDAS